MTAPLSPPLQHTTYDQSQCKNGIVHLGFGAFHRTHQAQYIDRYMQLSGDLSWGISAVNLRAEETTQFAANAASQTGYVAKSITPTGQEFYTRVRAHLGFHDWSTEPQTVEALLVNPDVHMLTITVTESGYYLDESGNLNADDPTIATEVSGGHKTSVYAYMMAALHRRKASAGQSLTILCCDNIRQNGKMLKRNFLAYLELFNRDDLADWVRANASFPCSMVDRITPRSTLLLDREINDRFGHQSIGPVMAEDFTQWVLEDNFASPMPDLSQVGVTVTADVDPYEEAKIRILNGGHTCIAYLAALAGKHTFDQAMTDAALAAHFNAYQTQEVLPALTIALPFDKSSYLDCVSQRFANAAIGDTVERICADGFTKFPLFIRPTLAGCLAQGIVPSHGLKSIASWYVLARHHMYDTLPLRQRYTEPNWPTLEPLLSSDGLTAFVTSPLLWGSLPARYEAFSPGLRQAIKEMELQWPV